MLTHYDEELASTGSTGPTVNTKEHRGHVPPRRDADRWNSAVVVPSKLAPPASSMFVAGSARDSDSSSWHDRQNLDEHPGRCALRRLARSPLDSSGCSGGNSELALDHGEHHTAMERYRTPQGWHHIQRGRPPRKLAFEYRSAKPESRAAQVGGRP